MSQRSPASPDMDSDDLRKLKDVEEEMMPVDPVDPALNNVVWRKLDRRVIPLCTCFFLLETLDRTNISNARVAGFQTSLGLSNNQYTMALTATYVSFIIAQFPGSLVMKYVGPRFFFPVMVTLRGVISGSQAFVTVYHQLLACRILLGVTEGGVLSAIFVYLSSFYPPKLLQLRIALFYTAASLADTFTGLLATGIDHMDGICGLHGWAWIFIMEGILTVVICLTSFSLLPRSPESVWFLTEEECIYVVSALKRAGPVSEDKFRWSEVVKPSWLLHVWLLGLVFFFSGTILSGLTLFEPTIVAGLGYTGNQAQFVSVPPFATTFLLSVLAAIISDRYCCRGYTSIFFALFQLIGFIMFYASKSNHVRYASLFFSVTGVGGVMPCVITWLANNTAPPLRRLSALAVCAILSELGGILSTWFLGNVSPDPNYTAAMITFIVMSVGTLVCLTTNLVYLSRENRLKAEKRRKMLKEHEQKDLGDRSAWFVYSL